MNTVQKRKVLFVIDTLQLGGAEQSLVANCIRFTSIEPVICHIYKGDILKPRFEEKGIKVHSFNLAAKYGFMKAYQMLNKVVKQEQPDLIVAYLTRSELVSRMVARANKIPVIGTFVNDLYTPTYNQHLSWLSKKVVWSFKTLNRLTAGICIDFLANSEAIRVANAKHLNIPLSKIQVINRGRDSKRIIRKQISNADFMKPIRFVNVSRLFPVKNHKDMILGFKKFAEKYPDATLDIVGDGPLREELATLIKNNHLENNITLLGARKDVPELLHNYDCFVFPTLVEGFSGAVVEAMFANLPVLASDIDQNKEAITHMHTGYLFKRESPDAAGAAMHWFAENRSVAKGFADLAYEDARKRFELGKIAEDFERYLNTKMISPRENSSSRSEAAVTGG